MVMKIGHLVATHRVADLVNENHKFEVFVRESFSRYMRQDWGDLCDEDRQQNDDAFANNNDRIFAAYTNAAHPEWKIWIITEWDHSVTTILFPDEY